ncbi:MAG TPA: hypothetical protein VFA97_05645 [Gaiellaceae bacterium]|nr:hypothetical protein [Gaiellaceae bacterium]
MRRASALVALTALALAAVPLARADGDPASDWLLTQPSFVPQDDSVPSAYATQLNAVLSDAKARGYEIRVAIIGTRYDMGSVYIDWLKPDQYAHFLGRELYFVYKGRLLVVMPNGLSVKNGNGAPAPAEQRVVDRIPAPGRNGAALTSAATHAVIALAANHGAIVALPTLGHVSKPTATRDRITIALAAFVVVVLLALGGLWRRRRKAVET